MAYKNQFDMMLPMEQCPECGKEFMRRCRREEWGYWSHGQNGLVLFCSSKCVKAYEDRKFMKRIKELIGTKAYAAYRMVQGGMYEKDAVAAVGLKSTGAISSMKLHWWKELKWLEAHGWTA